MKKKLLSIVLAAGMMVMMFAGCGGNSNSVKSDSQESSTLATDEKKDGDIKKIKLQLKWLPQSQFMGYYVAADKGYYKDEGLEVEILPGGSDIIPEQNVYNGVADVGVTWVSSLMTYQAQGYELQEVAQMFQKSGLLLVSKKDTGINSPSDLKGKKVGNWFGGNEYEVLALLEKYKLNKDSDLKLVQQDYTMDQIQEGSIDAASAMTYNEFGLLLENGVNKDDLNIIDMNDENVAMMEDCLFVNSEWASKNKDALVRFIRASIKGWQDACKDPEAAGKTVYNVDKSVSLEHQIYMAKEVAKLVTPEGFDSSKVGEINMDAIKQTGQFLKLYNKDLAADPVVNDKTFNSSYWQEATK
ncbi:ABC transporter substrate-binding protein [Clostridium butyricum]|uniref:ABC transporter substrate-binding protein n=1 Tax=Clostridium butyricum TaxID=1492 RepID=UPI002103531E|nr:ABC transporter substrate-binding protein [Clostridium butyricum]MCQ2014979.1 ABC transporter substrate-binding protein [Clostridium butyricum]MCQ2026932.1 ABC transporter substrate-binding protein [Clostridium butyricum]